MQFWQLPKILNKGIFNRIFLKKRVLEHLISRKTHDPPYLMKEKIMTPLLDKKNKHIKGYDICDQGKTI